LDFGTGTGCIAIALAAKCPSAKIIATDISPEALALAGENAARNNVADRIEFLQSDGFAAFQSEGRVTRVPNSKIETKIGGSQSSPLRKMEFDLIISNPPYIPSAEIATLQSEVRDFDPRGALDGGADGLDFYRKLAAEAKPFLKPDGKIMLEFGDGQADAIRTIFEAEKWIVEAVKEDYSHRARILIANCSGAL
jgi:release factor glutamine methyltransferase